MLQIHAYGRLSGNPIQRQTKSDKTMVTVSMAVNVTPHNAESDETMWINLLAFGKLSDTLLRHKKGDLISFSGRLTQSKWTPENGQERINYTVLIDSLISSRSVRPSTGVLFDFEGLVNVMQFG